VVAVTSLADELRDLIRTWPSRFTSDAERAAWFDRRADLFALIVAADPTDTNAAVSAGIATTARTEAARLRGATL
jgi:hypothetical protein